MTVLKTVELVSLGFDPLSLRSGYGIVISCADSLDLKRPLTTWKIDRVAMCPVANRKLIERLRTFDPCIFRKCLVV